MAQVVRGILQEREKPSSGFFLWLIFGTLLVLLSSPHLTAQSGNRSPTVGIDLGYERGAALGQFPVFNGSAGCGLFDNGKSEIRTIGGEILFPHLWNRRFGTGISLGWEEWSEEFTATPLDPQRIHDPQTNSVIELEREYRFLSSFSRIRLGFSGTFNATEHFSLFAGPYIRYQPGGTFAQYDDVLGPDSYLFEDGEVRHSLEGGTDFSPRQFGFGGIAGGGYRFPLGGRVEAQPTIFVRFDLQGPVSELQRSTVSGGLHLSILYNLSPPTQPDLPDPPLAAEDQKPDGIPEEQIPSSLKATLDLFCIDQELQPTDTARIITREVNEKILLFLPEEIEFREGEEELSTEYHLLTPEQTTTFSLDSMRNNGKSAYSTMLNLIGKRLRESPGSRLALAGSSLPTEERRIAERRVAAVTDYLSRVWSIAPDRIVTESGKEEGASVLFHLIPDHPVTPFLFYQTRPEYSPPTVRLSPRITPDTGIASWSITLQQGDQVLASYSNTGENRGTGEVAWEVITGNTERREDPLIALLRVVDIEGKEASARDTLPVRFVQDGDTSTTRTIIIIPIPEHGTEERRGLKGEDGHPVWNMSGEEGEEEITLLLPAMYGKGTSEQELRTIGEALLREIGLNPKNLKGVKRSESPDIQIILDSTAARR